jgi:hypothetical protein
MEELQKAIARSFELVDEIEAAWQKYCAADCSPRDEVTLASHRAEYLQARMNYLEHQAVVRELGRRQVAEAKLAQS